MACFHGGALEADPNVLAVRDGIIGHDATLTTPFGDRPLVYADYTASGRLVRQVEAFMADKVAPMYANSHTEASATGLQSTHFREEARALVEWCVDADPKHFVTLFAGTGMTGALMKLIAGMGIVIPPNRATKEALLRAIPESERPVVFVGPMEHHSNVLPWRESIADVVELGEALPSGDLDGRALKDGLRHYRQRKLKILTFSAGSNVTGITAPVAELARLGKAHGAVVIVDYAGAGPYKRVSMKPAMGVELDAIVMSPHKFVGGPGSSGLLIARRALFTAETPTQPGGGTVQFVSPHHHDYLKGLEAREDGGTPAILQAIRCGLAFSIRETVGVPVVESLCAQKCARALAAWKGHDNIVLVGGDRSAYWRKDRLPIISFQILFPRTAPKPKEARPPSELGHRCMRPEHGSRRNLHPNFVVALLNDLYGIQARSGCSCAGPYGARLWGFDEAGLDELRRLVLEQGLELAKPGWARVNMSWTMSDAEVDFVIVAVLQVAEHGWKLLPHYSVSPTSGAFTHRDARGAEEAVALLSEFSLEEAPAGKKPPKAFEGGHSFTASATSYAHVLETAMATYGRAKALAAPLAEEVLRPGGDFTDGDAGPLGPKGDPRARDWVDRFFVLPSEALRRMGIAGTGSRATLLTPPVTARRTRSVKPWGPALPRARGDSLASLGGASNAAEHAQQRASFLVKQQSVAH